MSEYDARAELVDVPGEPGEPGFSIFVVRYTRAGGPGRPVTYVYDGGPGTASLFVHLGFFGPCVVGPGGHLVDNPATPLEYTDLVILDPVGTGYSRAEGDARRFYGYSADIRSIARFIHLDLQRTGRWGSPKFVSGHSYGGQRTAGLLTHLQESLHVEFKGAVLLAPLLDAEAGDFSRGNDLGHVCALPTLAAAAWFHGRAGSGATLDDHIAEAERFAVGDYARALLLGGRLPAGEYDVAVEAAARLTGLEQSYVRHVGLRFHPRRYFAELMRSQGLCLSRQDMRVVAPAADAGAELPAFDPVLTRQFRDYAAAGAAYIAQLGHRADAEYVLYNREAEPWDISDVATGRYLNTADLVRVAMLRNPDLRIFMGTGIYDGSVPFFSAETALARALGQSEARSRVTSHRYHGGHSFFEDPDARGVVAQDLREFYRRCCDG
jgi:carboxypeptidase C (cathepsin A)